MIKLLTLFALTFNLNFKILGMTSEINQPSETPTNSPQINHTRQRSRSDSVTAYEKDSDKIKENIFSQEDYNLFCKIQRIAKFIINYNNILKHKTTEVKNIFLDFTDNSTINLLQREQKVV